ncbi:hypothetical protein [Microbacterium tumbae]
MTRFAVDAPTVLRLVAHGHTPDRGHTLVGPSALRTDVLALLYRETREGKRENTEARALLHLVAMLKIRLLGDRVSRSTAWRIASQLDADDPRPAEYLAVATLQADALVTDDPELRASAERVGLRIASYADLFDG